MGLTCKRWKRGTPAFCLCEKLDDVVLDKTGISRYPVGTIVVIDYPFFNSDSVKRRYAIVVESRKGFSKINDGAPLLCIDEDDPLMGATLAGITSSKPNKPRSDFDVLNYKPTLDNKIDVISRIYFGGVYVASDNTKFHPTGEETDPEILKEILKKFSGSVMSGNLDIVFDKELEAQFEQNDSDENKANDFQNEQLLIYDFRRKHSLSYRRLGA